MAHEPGGDVPWGDSTYDPCRDEDGTLCCAGCHLRYGSGAWADVVLTDADWALIAPKPHGGGVLCFNCICLRLAEQGRTENVPMLVTSGPFAFSINGEATDG